MAIIKSIINIYNKEVTKEKKTQAINCNCINNLTALNICIQYHTITPLFFTSVMTL